MCEELIKRKMDVCCLQKVRWCWDWEISMAMWGNVQKDLKYTWRVWNREKKC